MARFYADEDFDLRAVNELRQIGHDVLTVQEAGRGNRGVGDAEVLADAIDLNRCVLTFNRRDFIGLHQTGGRHRGIVVCTRDPDPAALASRIERVTLGITDLGDQLIRVNRP